MNIIQRLEEKIEDLKPVFDTLMAEYENTDDILSRNKKRVEIEENLKEHSYISELKDEIFCAVSDLEQANKNSYPRGKGIKLLKNLILEGKNYV